ncbi:respiratory nitrate reductase subunit gamma [Nocardia sp. NPDC049149]|uniref:respiratory nitrate reductase subunit gamma n=1 Tax=Nocardia sp. NPDC049149 TaxID=3364315 RepID=UPI00372190EC
MRYRGSRARKVCGKLSALIWIILPYSAFLSFVLGHVWRLRHDGFRRYTSGTGLHRAERIGARTFGLGVGLLVVARLTDLAASGPHTHPGSTVRLAITVIEILAAVPAVIGAMLLLVPNLITATAGSPVTPLDRVTFPLLTAGLLSRVAIHVDPNSDSGRYRSAETLFSWFRSLFTTHPQVEMMQQAPLLYQTRALILLLLIAIWPYTRLAGTFTRPIYRTIKHLASHPTRPARGAAAPGGYRLAQTGTPKR